MAWDILTNCGRENGPLISLRPAQRALHGRQIGLRAVDLRGHAERGVLVTPGDFYGEAGARHVRVAMTATDAQIDSVPGRLA